MHDRHRAGFYVGVCAEVSSYIDSCEDVEVYDGSEAGFFVVCLGAYIQDQNKIRFLLIH